MRYRKTLPFIVLILSMALAGCDAFGEKGNGALTASGTIAVQDVAVAPEVGGRVEQVYVNEGDAVEQGDVLFELGDALLQSQRSQAIAAVDAASATLDYTAACSSTASRYGAARRPHAGDGSSKHGLAGFTRTGN